MSTTQLSSAPDKPFALRIVHKGLALVIIPLVVNTIWIAMLYSCLSSAERLAAAERKQVIVLHQVNTCVFRFASAISSLAGYITTGDSLLKLEGDEHLQELRSDINTLKELNVDNKPIQDFAQMVMNTVDGELFKLEKTAVPGGNETTEQSMEMLRAFQKFIKIADATNKEVQVRIAEEQAKLDKLTVESVQSRQTVSVLIVAGLGVNFLLAIALAMFFNSDFTKRLALLAENAKRLPQHLSLNQTVTGGDELTELDGALHEAAEELARGQEYRRSLMQMMAHDLRSPLTSCLISLQLLVKNNEQILSPPSINQLKTMNVSIERLISLINDLLIIEKLEQNQMPLDVAPENLKEVCQTAVENVSGLAQAGRVNLLCNVDNCYISFDRERILQVLINYLSNAIKFSPAESTIEIAIKRYPEVVQISVVDQGPGLTPVEAKQLFQKFHQLKTGKKAGGSGLGLAIAKLIVESHGGEVGVISAKGHGSTFWLTLPFSAE